MSHTILIGDVQSRLAELPDNSVRTCITSPPYWGLRDYGVDGQLGLEATPEQYVENLVAVFRQVKRVLSDDGTLWLNLGDSYGLKKKDLVGIPWRVAFALQADGWYLRQDIIWAKPNPMPESVRDRCTKSHEYLFMLTKSPRYFYDNEAVKEPVAASSMKRIEQATFEAQQGGPKDYGNNDVNANRSARKALENFAASVKMPPIGGKKQQANGNPTYSGNQPEFKPVRNRRSVWTIPTKPFKGAHFAVMPEALVEPCVLAGSQAGDLVLDPFTGSGTVAVVALKHGRSFIGVELNPQYAAIAEERISNVAPTLNFEDGVA